MLRQLIIGAFVVLGMAANQRLAVAIDYKVEKLAEAAPADAIPASIAARLQTQGSRVIRGSSTVLCDLWWCKEWNSVEGFVARPEMAYPFRPGDLIGVVRYDRKGADFRDQDIESGVYTLRYAQQPVDGSHVGTSLTRDFLLLTQAAKDVAPDIVDSKQLNKRSAEAAGSSHPCMLSLQRVAEEVSEFPSMRYREETEWWIVSGQAMVLDAGKPKPMALELVIVGHAAE